LAYRRLKVVSALGGIGLALASRVSCHDQQNNPRNFWRASFNARLPLKLLHIPLARDDDILPASRWCLFT
jgi:hypothetical protein